MGRDDKSKSKKRKTQKKEKNCKKINKYSESSSSDNDEYEWVEKETQNLTSCTGENRARDRTDEKLSEREEWMNDNFFLTACLSNSDVKKRSSNTQEKNKTVSYNPGQSARELNPYWKNGGNGLPPNYADSINNPQFPDSNRSKKNLQSLEMQNIKECTSVNRMTSSSRRRKSSRSRSRSRSRERIKKYTSCYSMQDKRRRYQKPKDDSDDFQETAYSRSDSQKIKNWKKDKSDGRKYDSNLPPSQSNIIDGRSSNNTHEVKDCKSDITLTEADLNKLGARIIKAELMGDENLAAKLKIQLEEARILVSSNNNAMKTETVNNTDAEEKYMHSRKQYKQSTYSHEMKYTEKPTDRRRKHHSTHDDNYSIQEMIKYDKQDYVHAIKEHKELSKHMDNCYWCPDSTKMSKHMIVTMDSTMCLSLPTYTSLTAGHCILTPVQHTSCRLQLDKDTWERLLDLKKILTKMFLSENLYPVFFEIYKKRCKFSHMQLECVPLPMELGESAPMYFKKALLECETEWSINKKIVDLKDKDVRRAVPNGLPYFMVEFASHPGYAHVIEDEQMFPKNFAEEILGGMMDLDCNVWRRHRRQDCDEQKMKILKFTEMWKKHNLS